MLLMFPRNSLMNYEELGREKFVTTCWDEKILDYDGVIFTLYNHKMFNKLLTFNSTEVYFRPWVTYRHMRSGTKPILVWRVYPFPRFTQVACFNTELWLVHLYIIAPIVMCSMIGLCELTSFQWAVRGVPWERRLANSIDIKKNPNTLQGIQTQ